MCHSLTFSHSPVSMIDVGYREEHVGLVKATATICLVLVVGHVQTQRHSKFRYVNSPTFFISHFLEIFVRNRIFFKFMYCPYFSVPMSIRYS